MRPDQLYARLNAIVEEEASKSKPTWPMFRHNPQRTGFVDLTGGGDGNSLIVCGCYDGTIYALDLDGKKKWEFRTGDDFINSSAAIVENLIVVGSDTGNLHGLSFDGQELWRYEIDIHIRSSPVISGALVMLLCDGLLEIDKKQSGEFCLGISRFEGTDKWHFSMEMIFFTYPTIIGDLLLISDTHKLYCLGFDGKKKWEFPTGDNCSCIPVGEQILVYCDNGRMYYVDRTGGVKAQHESVPCKSIPAMKNDKLVVCTHGAIRCVSVEGKFLWGYKGMEFFSGDVRISPAIAQDNVVYATMGGRVHCRGLDGTERWIFDAKGGFPMKTIMASPAIVDDLVVIGSDNGCLYGISLYSGEERWRFERNMDFSASPAVVRYS